MSSGLGVFGVCFSAKLVLFMRRRVERVEIDETIEIASIDAVFMHIAENMAGCQKRLGEYPYHSHLRQSQSPSSRLSIHPIARDYKAQPTKY